MTSSSTLGTVVSFSSLSGRSLFSRLKSPLKSTARHFGDFYILPDDPHRQYTPGDIINGTVILKVLKPLRITHLVISLHGYAQVFKNPNCPGDGYRNYSTTVGSGKGKKGGSYFGNGFASLFEDEVVLCGEGRLAEGVYHFNFELEFPDEGLPSSIDFERGTISYMLTSTLTRPTTMSPTMSCDTKVYLQESIDVASVAEPKRRIISLEPISRRTRTKTSGRRLSLRPTVGASSQPGAETADSTQNPTVSALNSGAEESDAPGSPAPSDASFESQLSSGNASGTEYGIRSINTTVDDYSQNGVWSTTQDKTIMAAIDVLKGGFLRGDQIPIRVSVKHTKHVRSLRGIILTLYRQARVDMHPALPVLPNSKGDKMKSEDYYPKSRTGLGGLSLSSAGSSHLFRKDLSQSFAPLFVDPRTLTAEVKCAVRIPDDAFPTISNVPGAMISFKYFVEVVVDIQGKLTRLDRMLPNAGLMNVPTVFGTGTGMNLADDNAGSMFPTWSGTFVDTDALRRERGVVSCMFEVVIGTKDSERTGKKKEAIKDPVFDSSYGVPEIPFDSQEGAVSHADSSDHTQQEEHYGVEDDDRYYDNYAYDDAYRGPFDSTPAYYEFHTAAPPHHPATTTEPTSELSEKEQMRRAEERLLPSQPPGTADPAPAFAQSASRALAPSAPILPEDDDPNPPCFQATSPPSNHPPPFAAASPAFGASFLHLSGSPRAAADEGTRTTESDSSLTIEGDNLQQPPTQNAATNEAASLAPMSNRCSPHAPTPQYFASSSAHVQPTDDKHEVQRHHLALARSAPSVHETEGDEVVAEPSASPTLAAERLSPSAPQLNERDEGLVGPVGPSSSGEHAARKSSGNLPVYER